ncbi:MAG TPA: hypothetical protein DIT31_00925, partial [Methylophaga sp.]|nr:hypothetical protein [Methylophaga sp.]
IGGSADMGWFIGLLATICSHQSAYSGFGGLISLYRFVAKLISNLIHGVFMKKIRLDSILSYIGIIGLMINLALNLYAYFLSILFHPRRWKRAGGLSGCPVSWFG